MRSGTIRRKEQLTSKDHCKNIYRDGKTKLYSSWLPLQFKFKKMNVLGLWYTCKDHPVNLSQHVHYLDTEKLFSIKTVIFLKRQRGAVQDSEVSSAAESNQAPSPILFKMLDTLFWDLSSSDKHKQ